jgi:UDP-N-acetylmuramyl pentapeptide synthase
LAAVCASLILEVPIATIQEGLGNFKGLKGRTSIRNYKGIRIIEEINPGLNVAAVKNALEIMDDMDAPGVIFGGKYGVTCEEIDEKSVSDVLDKINENTYLVLTDELGDNVKNFLKRTRTYVADLDQAIESAIKNGCFNILLIYRSNFSDIKKR